MLGLSTFKFIFFSSSFALFARQVLQVGGAAQRTGLSLWFFFYPSKLP
jgi:hypothetical protein